MTTKQLNIRLDERLDRRLEELAARTGRTKTFYAGEAIAGFLEDWEDYFLAKDSLEEFRASGEEAVDVDALDFERLDG